MILLLQNTDKRGNMSMQSKVNEAAKRKNCGYNCAQAVACTYCDMAGIDEETAKQKAIDFIGKDNVKDVENLGYSENATIPEYNFSVKTNSEDSINISISKKGGHIVYMNSNRSVNAETISQ